MAALIVDGERSEQWSKIDLTSAAQAQAGPERSRSSSCVCHASGLLAPRFAPTASPDQAQLAPRAGDDGARRAKVALRGARGARVGAGLGPRSS